MSDVRRWRRDLPLFDQLRWFVRLRWGAGASVIAGALVADWVGLYQHTYEILAVGIGILAYNCAFRLLQRPSSQTRLRNSALITLAWLQITLDLGCLTLLMLWTGGGRSSLLGFFVFHMVIASLLLPRVMAYIGAGASWAMVLGGLWLTGQWPTTQIEVMALAGWMVTLLITVYLTSSITRSLQRHRRQVLRQRHRIRSMSDKLRRQSRAMVQHEKMAAMGQLAAGVAHEIANPLASMDSALQLMQRKPDRLSGQVVEKLREQIKRINLTVRQMTDFAHPGDQQWQKTTIDEIVMRSLQMLRFDHRLRSAHLKIQRELPKGAGAVSARPHAVEQVLVNLILNALDAMADQSEPHLDLRVYRQGQVCLVDVQDNGHGIAPEDIDHIFEPFFTTKPVGTGTGLGLTISYTTTRDHGGTIDVESSTEGTKFTISLPILDGVS
ncbi:hypothetical protein LCGC14_0254210 [marine sediment metagenome]|uniref:Histidine kinase domain-containing protein n=1 Tax=marine sediment metagenome TaxID=412755 RepID=A0A0F9U3T1_9ZZZZ|nr:hypothetical protein [Phycisphaerae bacterium]HDZ45100.1 hypothetical protein [Phycisphaerae bacterium]